MLRGSGSTGSSATCRERESMIWSGQSRARCCSCSTTATAAARPERAASTKSYSSTSMAPTTAYNLLNEYWNAMNYDDEVVQVLPYMDPSSSPSSSHLEAFSVLRTDSSLIQLNRQLKIQLPPSWIMGLMAKSRTEEGGGFREAQLQELREIKPKKDSGQCNVLASMLWVQWKIVRTINESMNKLTSQCKSIWWSLYCPVLL